MTPKTQSVCKHTTREEAMACPIYRRLADVPDFAGKYFHGSEHFEPVAEPVSTGEPPTITDGFGSEWPLRCEEDGCGGVNQVMRPGSVQCSKEHLHNRAARPSEPSAPRNAGKCWKCEAGLPHEWQFCEPAPQASAELPSPLPVFPSVMDHKYVAGQCHTHGCHFLFLQNGGNCANCGAPQPVSGDAPKVEEIVRGHWKKRLLYNLPDLKPHEVDKLMDDASEDIQSWIELLRPYFLPASQTPTRDAVKWLEDMGYGVNGKFALNSKRNWQGYEIKEILELFALGFPESGRTDPLATPASTARTDATELCQESQAGVPQAEPPKLSPEEFLEQWADRHMGKGNRPCGWPNFGSISYTEVANMLKAYGAAQPGDDKPEGAE